MRILIIIVIALNLFGCEQTHCPAFPLDLVEYYPYINGDRLKFKNSINDTLVLNINNNWFSDSYSFDWNCKCSCGADAGFSSEMDTIFSIEISGSIDVSNDTKVSILNCTLSDGKVSNDNFSFRVDGVNPFLDESADLFVDTIILKNVDIYRFNNVLIVKSEGIIEFWDEKQNCVWSLIE